MCSIDAQRYEKYNKDKMQVFLSSSTLVVLRKYLEEGTNDVSETDDCRETFSTANKFMNHLLEVHKILDTTKKEYHSTNLVCSKCQSLRLSNHNCGTKWYCGTYLTMMGTQKYEDFQIEFDTITKNKDNNHARQIYAA